MSEKALVQYRQLLKMLLQHREMFGTTDDEEEAYAVDLDDLWWEMTDDERAEIEAEIEKERD